MIKKLLVLSIMLCLSCLMVCGCKSGNPNNLNETLYNKGKKAVKITQKYLDTDLSVEEAGSKMKQLAAQTKKFQDSSKIEEQNAAMSIDILKQEFINAKLLKDEDEEPDDKDIQDTLNDLKKELDSE